MVTDGVIFREINHIDDDFLCPWLDLYETAFPPHERFLVSRILSSLKTNRDRHSDFEQLLAVLDPTGKFIGMAMMAHLMELKIAALWYLAVCPEERNKGYGAKIYQKILHQLKTQPYKALLFDVEKPEVENTGLAVRRIQFYRRQGARLMGGIRYRMSVGGHQPTTPFNIMIHLLQPTDAESAFWLVRSVYQDAVQQTGPIELD